LTGGGIFMDDTLYERLAEALDHLPNGFPRTSSGIEIEILRIVFLPDEAEIACALSDDWESADQIAVRLGADAQETEDRLRLMSDKALVCRDVRDGSTVFRLGRFIVGIWEAAVWRLDGEIAHRFAHLTEEYLAETGGLAGIMTPAPAIHRVVPSRGAAKSEWILPYDDVRTFLDGAKSFVLRDCVCRKQQDLLGRRRCTFTRRACLSFSPMERPKGPDSISREEALAALDEFEKMGLVHTVSNVAKGISYVCNCCGCCCEMLRGITDFGLKDSIAYANYYCAVDSATCSGCRICETRCQMRAMTVKDGIASIDRERCIGCGLCVTGCSTGAAHLRLKPADQVVAPPADIGDWSRLRKAARGLS